jgi:hypothetical protein
VEGFKVIVISQEVDDKFIWKNFKK